MSVVSDALVTPDNLRDTSNGIFYADQDFSVFDAGVIRFLKGVAGSIDRRRARVCAHPSPEAEQHDMLIVSHRDTYVAPHRHLSKSESFLIIEGAADVILFSEDGDVTERFLMGQPDAGLPFFYRMPERLYHSLWIESEFLVFVESTKGPFLRGETEFAPWAPDPNATAEGQAYLQSLGVADVRSA